MSLWKPTFNKWLPKIDWRFLFRNLFLLTPLFKSLIHHKLSQPQFGWECLFVFYFQVGVEIRDELQLIAPSEIRHDIYREVSKKRRMIETIRALGAIIWHRHISIFHKFSRVTLRITFKLSFPNNQQITVLKISYSVKLTVNVYSFAFNVLRATCCVIKIFTITFCFQFIYNKSITYFSVDSVCRWKCSWRQWLCILL
jgi:hypothetical protein